MFKDRRDAGRQLAEELSKEGVQGDIVLAIPRGGLPLGRKVADRLGIPLDIIVARKIGAPHNPELAIGAVGSDGTVWLNEDMIESMETDDEYIERNKKLEEENAREKAKRYRGDKPVPDLKEKDVIIVDDGVATGATATACIRLAREAGASKVILAVAVGSPETVESLEEEADDVICVETPSYFRAVGQFYESFGQVSDEEAMEYLEN
ncbi:MAG: phosphoribosyltransferase [Halobacteria archaeon]|nr:phosphoribosyltransferase [Halobacteria archaeon]